MSFAPCMMVKQWLGEIETEGGDRYRVFETGDAKFVLIDPIDRHGASLCMQFPMRKTRMRRGWLADGIRRRLTSAVNERVPRPMVAADLGLENA